MRHLSRKLSQFSGIVNAECNENVIRILVGNKIDLEGQRKVDNIEGSKLAIKFGLDRYAEISALLNIEIQSTIEDILVKIQRRKLRRKTSESSINISNLSFQGSYKSLLLY